MSERPHIAGILIIFSTGLSLVTTRDGRSDYGNLWEFLTKESATAPGLGVQPGIDADPSSALVDQPTAWANSSSRSSVAKVRHPQPGPSRPFVRLHKEVLFRFSGLSPPAARS